MNVVLSDCYGDSLSQLRASALNQDFFVYTRHYQHLENLVPRNFMANIISMKWRILFDYYYFSRIPVGTMLSSSSTVWGKWIICTTSHIDSIARVTCETLQKQLHVFLFEFGLHLSFSLNIQHTANFSLHVCIGPSLQICGSL